IGVKKSTVCTRAISSVIRYTPASSLVSKPTRRFGSVGRGRRFNTESSKPGLILAAQPAAFTACVSRTDWSAKLSLPLECRCTIIAPGRRRRLQVYALGVSRRRTNRDRDDVRRFFGGGHEASPVENGTRLDNEAGSVDFARHNGLRLNLHSTFRANHAVKPSRDHHRVPGYLAVHAGVLSQDERS